MKLGLIITMYDEIDIVYQTIEKVKSEYPDSVVIVVHSDANIESELLSKIKEKSNEYILLSNLGETYSRYEVPTQSITRNVSVGCKKLLEMNADVDCVTIITGDTLITDPQNLKRRYEDMVRHNCVAMVAQAIGSPFHSPDDDPPNNISGHRIQHENITDIMPQLILVDGKFFKETEVFSDIKITNRWTSEQCLGDELMKGINNQNRTFKEHVGILNAAHRQHAYAYRDGITYHAKSGNPSR